MDGSFIKEGSIDYFGTTIIGDVYFDFLRNDSYFDEMTAKVNSGTTVRIYALTRADMDLSDIDGLFVGYIQVY